MQTPPLLPPDAVSRFRILRPTTVKLSADGVAVVAAYDGAAPREAGATSRVEYRSAWARFSDLADLEGRALTHRVVAFVRRFGVLGVDSVGRPRLMPEVGSVVSEDVRWFGYYARLGKAIVDAAGYAKGNLANAPRASIRVLREYVETGHPGGALREPFVSFLLYDHLALTPPRDRMWGADTPPPRSSVEQFRAMQGRVAASVLNVWLAEGHVFPGVLFVPGGFESRVGGGLWGALGAAIVEEVLERTAKDRRCDVCGARIDISKRARAPQAGRLVLCSGKAGEVCRREAGRRRVARHRATRVVADRRSGVEV